MIITDKDEEMFVRYKTCVCKTDPFLYGFQAMASTEDRAYEIMRELDVDYVLVIFGGLTGYSSDGKLFCISGTRG